MNSPSKPETAFEFSAGDASRDETRDASGNLREPWRYVVDSLETLGAEAFAERQEKARRILRDDGATYNIYDSAQPDRTWSLDLVPWVIGSEDWSVIESGLLERSELFNLILQDIYGPRELILRGVVPPEVIFGHAGFLRPCQGIRLPGEQQLILHAVDMVRRPDGQMCVISDRTQAPSGAGYALENRTVMSRVFPSLFRDSHVHRLALFFQNLRQKLMELAPGVPSPRIVVLTPGPYNETYFEHAYLANYLGFSLVQSGDLAVRNGRVWMKSLDGLMPVDVILRRVDDDFCDPVELRRDSQLGIPGLLQVVRDGGVVVANPLGSGILENPALLRYLPAIARHFLGREPRLATVETWWGGAPDDLDYMLGHLDELVIKPVCRTPGAYSQDLTEMAGAERADVERRLRANPSAYVGQTRLLPTRLPAWAGSELQPRPAVLRTYSVASESSYRSMPGGLTRIGAGEADLVVSSQAGSASKDTWVLASEPEKQLSLRAREIGPTALAEPFELPSRVVENLFWMGRYAERAESGLRLLRTVFLQTAGINPLTIQVRRALLQAVTRLTATYPGFTREANLDEARAERELLAVILDGTKNGSIRSCITAMLNCAKEARELLSADTQRIINDIHDQFEALKADLNRNGLAAPEETLAPLITSLLALSGLAHESMIRAMGWRFMDMGRRLERALQLVTLARSLMVTPLEEGEENQLLESLLMTAEALISYRRRYRAALSVPSVLDLVLLDVSNPRSVLHQLETVQEHLGHLPTPLAGSRELTGERRFMLEAVNLVKLSELSALAEVGPEGKRQALDQLFSRLYYLLAETANTLGRNYFAHAAGPRQLVRPEWERE